MSDEMSAWQWWESRRLKYNIGLAVAGWLAFFLYAAVIELAPDDIPPRSLPEITLFTTLIQGIGYLFVMAVANVFYCLGMFAEGLLKPDDKDAFRIRFFRLGYWFSFLIPFAIPVMVQINLFLMMG